MPFYPEELGVDFDGKLYVSSQWHELKLDTNGALLSFWGAAGTGPGKFSYAGQAAFDRSNHVFILDGYNARVEEFDTNGNFITAWGSQGSGPGQFDLPYGLAVGSDGRIYVSDGNNNRVQIFTSPGVFESQFGSIGTNTGQFSFPEAIATDSSNNLYVIDAPGGAFDNYRVQKFDSNGNFLIQWGPPGVNTAGSIQIGGVATDQENNVYVADGANQRVQKFSSTGAFLSEWGTFGTGPGQFNQPSGIAVDPSGNYVYVSDSYNSRVEVFAYAALNPLIYLPPTNQVVPAGIGLALSVGVFGAEPLSYQWQFNGVDLAGATSASLVLSNTSIDVSGPYQLLVSNWLGVATSSVGLITVDPLVVTTLVPTNVSASAATLKGSAWVGDYASTAWFEWGTSTNYGNVAGLTNIAPNSSVIITNLLGGLSGDLMYHYRCVGSNLLGAVYGLDIPFQVGLKPSALTLPITIGSSNSVFLHAEINPEGRDTAAFIHWGSFSPSGSSTPTNHVPGGSGPTTLSYQITGLVSGAIYSSQTVASNSAGVFSGNIVNFVAPPWELLPVPVGQEWTALASSADGTRLEAVSGSGDSLSYDSGMSWTTNRITPGALAAVCISADGTNLVLGTGESGNISGPAYVSTNSGTTWLKASSPNRNWFSLACSGDGLRVAAVDAAAHIVVTSTDRGLTWQTNSPPVFAFWSSIASSADGPNLIVAAGGFNGSTNGPVFTSTDAGATWKSNSLPISNWKTVASSSDGRILAAAAGGLHPGNVYVSTNAGEFWTLSAAPFTNWQSVALSADGKKLVALARVAANPLYISRDLGASWQSAVLPQAIWTAVAISADGSTIFASGDRNIFRLRTVESPELSSGFRDGNLTLSWVIGAAGYQLQQAPDLSGLHWTNVPVSPAVVLTNLRYRLDLPTTAAAGFYRLRSAQ
jgi:DNA-binding beta-propeller fold protein YncE